MSYKHVILTAAVVSLSGCLPDSQKSYPISSASYEVVNSEVGCDSKYSEEKKKDIFNARFKNHRMSWRGEIVLAESDEAALNLDGKGIQDLIIDFTDKNAGYNLTKGKFITVSFVMRHAGGCLLPFSGDLARVQ